MLLIGSGSIIAQVISVLSTPVITRLYSPDSYAGWALLISVMAIFGVIATFRYELAIILASTEEEAANIFAAAISLVAIVALIALPLCLFWKEPVSELFGLDANSPWLLWSPLLVVATGMIQTCQSWCTRKQKFQVLAASSVVLVLLTAIGQVGIALYGIRGASSLIAGTILGQTAAALFIFFAVLQMDGRNIVKSLSLPTMRAMMWQYRNYPFFMTPYTLVAILRERLVLLMLNSYAPKAQVGFYAFSSKIVNLPVGFISSTIRPVLFQKASVSKAADLSSFLVQLMSQLVYLVTPFWILFMFEAQNLITWVFGAQWGEAAFYGVLLAVPGFVFVLSNWMDRILDVIGQQRLAFKMEALFSIGSMISFVIGLMVLKDIKYAVILQISVVFLYSIFWIWKLFSVAKFDLGRLLSVLQLFLKIAAVSSLGILLIRSLLPPMAAVGLYLCFAIWFSASKSIAAYRMLKR